MLRRLFSILSIVFLLVLGQTIDEAQFCETFLTNEQIRYELNAGFPQPLLSQNFDERIVLSITAHILKTKSGKGGISETDVLNAVNQLNKNFFDTKISFEVCKFNYINNTRLYRFNRADELFLTQHGADSMINVYFVNKILGMEEGNVCGYTYYPTKGLDHLVMSNNCIGNGTTLSHEMGHFFGLYHTHEEKFGIELVNGNNCISAGDLICDTSADPGLQFASVNENCEYIGLVLDPTKMLYNPPVNNLMSYSRKLCRRSFTIEQSDKIRINYHIFKSHLKKLDFGFATPDPLIVKGQKLDLKAEGGVKYLWNTGDTTNLINVQPDSSQLYSVYIFTASGCSIYKEFYAEVIGSDKLMGPDIVCKGNQAEILVNNTKSSRKYQLQKNNEPIGEPVIGNDSSITLLTGPLQENSSFSLLIINEEENVLEAPQLLEIQAMNVPIKNYVIIVPEDTICKGRSGELKIPNSITEVAYQLILNGKPLFKPLMGTGDTLTMVTDAIQTSASFDIVSYNNCTSILRKNAFTLHVTPGLDLDLEIHAEKQILKPGEATRIIIEDTDTTAFYQIYAGNKPFGKMMKGNGDKIAFRTGTLNEDTDFCIYIVDEQNCGNYMSQPVRVGIKKDNLIQIVYENETNPIISYNLPRSSKVKMVLKEIIGTKEFIIKDTFEKSGEHTFALNNLNLSPKLYLLTISINNAQALYQLI
ncbi:MAG: M43 family zinc metalloprotease, partial [Bacteroidota bacterium]|nr:M43 family zinc metalloprotease [Bacteroidota bacterium]